MVLSLATLGLTLYALGLGLLGGFVGNILAGWYNTVTTTQKSDEERKNLINIFVGFGVVIVIVGMILIFLFT